MVQDMQVDMRNGGPRSVQVPEFAHVAVMCPAEAQPGPWGAGPAASVAAALQSDVLVRFVYFPIAYESETAGNQISAAFGSIERQSNIDRFDAVLIIGGPHIEIGPDLMHRVLAPCIAGTTIPVLTALGPDDAATLLGDVAFRVFADPCSLATWISEAVRGKRASCETVIAEIRSLAQFLVTEHIVEAKILMASVTRPAVERHFAAHAVQGAESRRKLEHIAETLRRRIHGEIVSAATAQERIGAGLATLAHRRNRKIAGALWRLRLGVLCVLLGVVGLSWYFTTPAVSVFSSGCALVLLSAIYASLGNRIAAQPITLGKTNE